MKRYDEVLKDMLKDSEKAKKLKKVLLAYDFGYEEYTDEVDAIIEKVYDYYMDTDTITYFENEQIVEHYYELIGAW